MKDISPPEYLLFQIIPLPNFSIKSITPLSLRLPLWNTIVKNYRHHVKLCKSVNRHKILKTTSLALEVESKSRFVGQEEGLKSRLKCWERHQILGIIFDWQLWFKNTHWWLRGVKNDNQAVPAWRSLWWRCAGKYWNPIFKNRDTTQFKTRNHRWLIELSYLFKITFLPQILGILTVRGEKDNFGWVFKLNLVYAKWDCWGTKSELCATPW